MSKIKSRRDENTELTRNELLDSAQETFASSGFSSARTEAIAKNARVTRGAFYHHFTDKLTLFDAVVVRLSQRAANLIQKKVNNYEDPWEKLINGLRVYLEICTERDYSVIVVQNAPAVLGELRYREIDEQNASALLVSSIFFLVKKEKIRCEQPRLLARMLTAMVCKAALINNDAELNESITEQAVAMINTMVRSFDPKYFNES